MIKANRPILRLSTSYDVVFSPDSNRLATCGQFTWLWDWRTHQKSKPIKVLSHPGSLNFSLDNEHLAIKNSLGEVAIVNATTGDLHQSTQVRVRDEGCRTLFVKGNYLMDGSWEGKIYLRHIDKLHPVIKAEFPNCMVCDADYYAAEDLCAFAITQKATIRGEMPPPFSARVMIGDFSGRTDEYVEISGKWSFLHYIRFSPTGDLLALVYDHRFVDLFDWRRQESIASICLPKPLYCCELNWSGDGKWLVVVTGDRFWFYHVNTLDLYNVVPIPYACSVNFSSSNEVVALGSWKNGLVYSVEQLMQTPSLEFASVQVAG